MAYGTPASPDDIEAYYTHIRRGNAPSPEQLAELTARYEAIGGISPLAGADRGPARRSGPSARRRGRPARSASCSARSTRRRSSRTPSPRSPATGIERVVGLVLAPALRTRVGRRVPGAARGRGRRARDARRADRQLAPRARLPGVPDRRRPQRARRAARAHQGALHRPLAARAGAGRRPLPRPAARVGRRRRRGRGAEPLGGLVGVLAVGGTHGRPVAGTGRPRCAARAGRRPSEPTGCSCARRASSATTSRWSTTSTSKRGAVADEVGLAFARTKVLNDMPSMFDALADRVLAAAPT